MKFRITPLASFCAIAVLSLLAGCTQEQQNKISRDIQNWTGTNGVLEVYAGDKVARRFMQVDKISTALGTDDGKPRAYRYGYGVLDENLNMTVGYKSTVNDSDPTDMRMDGFMFTMVYGWHPTIEGMRRLKSE